MTTSRSDRPHPSDLAIEAGLCAMIAAGLPHDRIVPPEYIVRAGRQHSGGVRGLPLLRRLVTIYADIKEYDD